MLFDNANFTKHFLEYLPSKLHPFSFVLRMTRVRFSIFVTVIITLYDKAGRRFFSSFGHVSMVPMDVQFVSIDLLLGIF